MKLWNTFAISKQFQVFFGLAMTSWNTLVNFQNSFKFGTLWQNFKTVSSSSSRKMEDTCIGTKTHYLCHREKVQVVLNILHNANVSALQKTYSFASHCITQHIFVYSEKCQHFTSVTATTHKQKTHSPAKKLFTS